MNQIKTSPGALQTGVRAQSRPWIDAGAQVPFVFLSQSQGAVQVQGTPAALVGHRMRVPGDARPRGLWGEWAWDGETLTAAVDPMGYFSLYVYAKGGQIGLSPSILHLLQAGADPEPDDLALAVFHRVGFFVGDDTPFRHIRTLPPNARLTWARGKLSITGGPPAPKTLDLSREQAVEAFIELPRAAISRFLGSWDGPIALPLTGGRDSRHILLEMAHQGRKPDTCLTFHHGGSALNAEVQSARAVAGRVGVTHRILGHPRLRLRDCVRGLLMTQLCADEHAQMMPMHDFLSGSAYAAVDGIGGDILTNPDDWAAGFMERARRGDYTGIARGMAEGHGGVISRPGHRGGAGAVFSPELDAAAIARIADAVKLYDDAPDPYQAFWFWHRTRREISFTSTAVMGGAAMVFNPYLDPDFVELGLSLPWDVTCDQKLHDDAIFRAYPAYADIPFASGFRNQPLSKFRLHRVANAVDALRIAAIAGPGSALQGVRAALRETPLNRIPSDILRLHDGYVRGMDAAEAQRLIALSTRLSAAAVKGEGVVSHVHSDP
ncbi:hypothetical protein [Pararhodobacter zhoushanensis]|uniref:hypothetical protein n=1 Tax=Pararhodobacter zhoushanensis TaxID=2479545 RepID=UPI000F8DA103|nr:hypothetical protein [Pararhodobacter zhoushanensis]